jgi:hypothetical protein
MRSQKYHDKTEIPTPTVVDEASRLTINGTEDVNVYQVDDQGNKVQLLASAKNMKIKLHDVNEIIMESKGDFNSVIEGPEPLDNTPLEVPVERPLTQTQQLKMWLQNEENMRNFARHELSWDEFKDLGSLDDGDDFYKQFNPELTKYEMQAEALRQEANPLRGNPVSDAAEKNNLSMNLKEETTTETVAETGTTNNSGTTTDSTTGQVDNSTQ